MIIAEACYEEMINAIAREIRARVELYDGSTLLDTYTYDGALQSYVVERVGENKFFGYGICQKLTVQLRDKERKIDIKKGQGLEVVVGVGCEYLYTCPIFFVDEVVRDENTNNLTITAYDSIYGATSHTIDEVELPTTYTIRGLTNAIGAVLGVPVVIAGDNPLFDVEYPTGINVDGTENLRDILDDIAEATGTIYYMCCNWNLTFKTLDIEGDPVLHIDKSKYFTLSTKTAPQLAKVSSVTELGDNVTASMAIEGEHQYLRDNCLLDTRDDVDDLLQNILVAVGGLTITQFDVKWRGNFLLEIGDKISLTTKDDEVITAYVLNDTITYNGGLVGKTSWSYQGNESETDSTPATIFDSVKATYAKVDKINKEITLVASDVSENSAAISSLQINTEGITASVSNMENRIEDGLNGVNAELTTLTSKVETKISSEDLTIAVKSELANGVNKVVTEKGYTFSDEGLRIQQTGSEMESLLDENGLSVFRDNTEVLTADNTGVNCINVTARQYLIIAGSRFEDYNGRTGVFWIG